MTVGIQHSFASAKSDGGDATLVRPSDWNAEHKIDGVSFQAATSFPGSPTADDLCYRTDLNLLCFYDGTRWLTVHVYTLQLAEITNNGTSPFTGLSAVSPSLAGDIYVTKLIASTLVSTTNDGTKYWTCKVSYKTAPNTDNDLTGFTFNTSADSVTTFTSHVVTPTAVVLTSTALALDWIVTKTSTPGNCYVYGLLEYRRILT